MPERWDFQASLRDAFRLWFGHLLESRSDDVTLAVGFNPRFDDRKEECVA